MKHRIFAAIYFVVIAIVITGCAISAPSGDSPVNSPDPAPPAEQPVSDPAPTAEQPVSDPGAAPSIEPPGPVPPGEPPSAAPEPVPSDIPVVSVHVLDVGDGLSVLIDSGEAEVLIDGGYMKYGEAVSRYIGDHVDGDLEYVIATHSDSDHVGGLIQVYADYQVNHTIYGNTATNGNYPKFETAAKNEPNSEYRNDESEVIDLGAGVTLRIIDIIDGSGDVNDDSVISLLSVGDKKLLVTGDAQAKTERLLAGLIGRVDVDIVAHHGSETSSSQAFLDEIRPEYGIVSSAGPSAKDRNPDEEVMTRLESIGTKLYATYRSGNITITFDNGSILFSPPSSEQITLQNYKDAA
jgi:beta-lactamase superfamily II metal-dependent hydrolase